MSDRRAAGESDRRAGGRVERVLGRVARRDRERTPLGYGGLALVAAGCYVLGGPAGALVGVATAVVRWAWNPVLAIAALFAGLAAVVSPPAATTVFGATASTVPASPTGLALLGVGLAGLLVEPAVAASRPSRRVLVGAVLTICAAGGALALAHVAAVSLWVTAGSLALAVVGLAGAVDRAVEWHASEGRTRE